MAFARSKNLFAMVIIVLAMSGGVGSGLGMQGDEEKWKKVYFISNDKKRNVMWKWMWTRFDWNRKHPIEWNDSASHLGIPDDADSYALEDESGNTFRPFFVVCDIGDLISAGFKSQVGYHFIFLQNLLT